MDSIFNYVIFLIPLAIFIGRAVMTARNKKNASPPSPPVLIHFEEDDDEMPPLPGLHHANPHPAPKTAAKPAAKPVLRNTAPRALPVNAAPAAAQAQAAAPMEASPGQALVNISRLPPLKQAVVWAEILGAPKALQ